MRIVVWKDMLYTMGRIVSLGNKILLSGGEDGSKAEWRSAEDVTAQASSDAVRGIHQESGTCEPDECSGEYQAGYGLGRLAST